MATIQPLVLDELSGIWNFLVSIEWRDPCMVALIAFHVIVTSTVLLTRNHSNFQIILFFILLLLVYFSENINELASNNWRLMATHQYFDSKGMFISMVFSIPILLNCMGMVASWLYQSSQLMTKLKKAQLRQQAQLSAQGKQVPSTYGSTQLQQHSKQD
ncbi:transmembrane protein 18 [Thrips palmi]|uniref:Transmembrane protein 18 n=1 Tax=Thrips palmi TaxID=161013 RepID=A0A6P8Y3F8_THRPL|nr:transmembrane protein 18 [Thrips palmi]